MVRELSLKCALGLFFLGISVVAFAQESSLEGVLIQEGTNEAVAGANIFLEELKIGTATDGKGKFKIDGLAAGSYTLAVSSVGFETLRQSVVLQAGKSILVNLQIKEQFIEIPGIVIERVSLSGGRQGIKDIPGSVHYLGPAELQKFNYNDVNRILRQVPGVNIQEEEGFGLRPNIGLRGSGVERSSKISIMEDGVLMAPAPYAAPAAYYFPTVGRMQGIEVRKGSSQIKYGPYTTGGAINFISTQIPDEFSGRVNILGGSFGSRMVHAFVGDAYKNFGFVAETYQTASNGFKDLDAPGGTGFNLQDYLVKFRVNTNQSAKIHQTLSFKVAQTTGESDETYLGLTDADFALTPFRRYSGSQKDVINTKQTQFLLRHTIQPLKNVDITTSLYRTEFSRNWYKLDKVQATEDGDKVGISAILANPGSYTEELAIIKGGDSPIDQSLAVKANNRDYYARGLQTVIGYQIEAGETKHDLELGLRFHKDQIDRFQWVDHYRMDQGLMELTQSGTPGTESNRIETARAFASYLQYNFKYRRWTIVPGLRYENIEIARLEYGKTDPDRTGSDLSTRQNQVDVFIPGVGLEYRVNQQISTFLGIHKGFSPPGSKEGTQPEESVNYEIGFRYDQPNLRFQSVFFFNDYSNLLGADLASSGGQGTTDQFNGGDVNVSGVEVEASYDLLAKTKSSMSLPISMTYTFTEGEFQNSFESEFEGWGTVNAGDDLPYLPKHQLAFSLGLEHRKFNFDISSKYQSPLRTIPGQGDLVPTESTDSQFVVDFASNYSLYKNIRVFGRVNNLLNQEYSVARRPAGLRPGMPRSFMLGVKADF